MKKSNKILITFAAALILIPLMGMIYVSQVNYKVGDYSQLVADKSNSKKSFKVPTEDMESKAISTPFTEVNIADAKGRGLYIQFIEDENYGVKFPNDLKEIVTLNVDANGSLQISFIKEKEENRRYSTLIIYGKKIKQLNISNANDVYFDITSDSTAINVKKTSSLTLNKDITLNALQITTEEVKDVAVNEIKVKSLTLNLAGANFKSDDSSFDNLAINSTGNVEIEINGGRYDHKQHSINNLFVNAKDAGSFKIDNVKIEKCSGDFSDQTKVQMPAINLKQMYKK